MVLNNKKALHFRSLELRHKIYIETTSFSNNGKNVRHFPSRKLFLRKGLVKLTFLKIKILFNNQCINSIVK